MAALLPESNRVLTTEPSGSQYSSMDIPRPAFAKARRRRRIWGTVAATVVLALITYLISRLEPAAPSVEGGPLYRDVVKRGPMLRAVRGPGTLVPEKVQYVQADTDGRVERILVLPGAEVKAETIIMELSNPELKQAAFDVEWQIKAAEAQFVRLKVQLESDRLSQEAVAATLKAEYTQAVLEALADEELAKDGLVAGLTAKRSRAKADELGIRSEIEKKRISISSESVEAQLDVQRAELEKLRASFALKQRQVEGLRVRAGIDGVLQQIGDRETLQVGQRISPSATLAKIVQPSKLKAEIKISETQAKDLLLGQVALIDTRNGVVPGHVVRIDPASQNGTRTVDVALDGALPRGAVPELSVDGTIELERLHDVIYVGRPATPVEPGSTISLFKVIEAGKYAVRIPVKLGRSSVTTIEVLEGLQPGDTIILSDMSSVDGHDRIRLN